MYKTWDTLKAEMIAELALLPVVEWAVTAGTVGPVGAGRRAATEAGAIVARYAREPGFVRTGAPLAVTPAIHTLNAYVISVVYVGADCWGRALFAGYGESGLIVLMGSMPWADVAPIERPRITRN